MWPSLADLPLTEKFTVIWPSPAGLGQLNCRLILIGRLCDRLSKRLIVKIVSSHIVRHSPDVWPSLPVGGFVSISCRCHWPTDWRSCHRLSGCSSVTCSLMKPSLESVGRLTFIWPFLAVFRPLTAVLRLYDCWVFIACVRHSDCTYDVYATVSRGWSSLTGRLTFFGLKCSWISSMDLPLVSGTKAMVHTVPDGTIKIGI